MQPILVAVCGEEVASHFPSQFKLVYDTLCTFLPLSLHHCTTTCLSSTYCAFALERLHGKLPSTLPWQRKRRNDQHDSRNMWTAWWSRVTGKPTTLWLVEGHFLQLQQAPMQNQKLATRQRGPKNPRVRWMTPPPKKKKETKNPILSIDPPSTLPRDLSMPSNETSQGHWALKHKTAAFRATAAAFFSCSRSSSSFFRLALSSAKWSRPPFFSKACYFRNLWIWHLVTVRLQSSFTKIK